MNEPGTDPRNELREAGSDAANAELRRIVNLLFAGLALTSFTLTAYLGLEARRASAELAVVKASEEKTVKAVHDDDASAEGIFNRLADFAKTHPDFQKQIFYKYNASVTPSKK
jgi:hypothetical protein